MGARVSASWAVPQMPLGMNSLSLADAGHSRAPASKELPELLPAPAEPGAVQAASLPAFPQQPVSRILVFLRPVFLKLMAQVLSARAARWQQEELLVLPLPEPPAWPAPELQASPLEELGPQWWSS